jgi:predicted HTH domain antitoxin
MIAIQAFTENNMQITLEIPDEMSQLWDESDWLREIAIALFEQELITLSRASKIARMHPIDFQKLLGSRGINVHYDLEEFEQDIKHLQERGWL